MSGGWDKGSATTHDGVDDLHAHRDAVLAARALCAFVVVLGTLVLIGWAWDIPTLKSILPHYITIKANTAVGMIMLAIATALTVHRPYGWRLVMAYGAAGITVTLSVLTLLEYGLGYDFGIDQLLFLDPLPAGARFPPGRLAPITAVCFLMISAAFVAQTNPYRRLLGLSRFFLWLSFLLAFQALVSYVLDVKFLFGKAFYSQMAVHTTLMFIALCSALLVAQRLLSQKETSPFAEADASFQRRLVAAAIVVPPVVQCLLQMGRSAGFL